MEAFKVVNGMSVGFDSTLLVEKLDKIKESNKENFFLGKIRNREVTISYVYQQIDNSVKVCFVPQMEETYINLNSNQGSEIFNSVDDVQIFLLAQNCQLEHHYPSLTEGLVFAIR
jgi:cellobiose-specific phosphotransferase system component IIB